MRTLIIVSIFFNQIKTIFDCSYLGESVLHGAQLKIMREDLDFLPTVGYSAIDKTHYFGYKLDLVLGETAVSNTFH